MNNNRTYSIWFPPDREIVSMATLYSFQESAGQVGVESVLWDHKNQVYVTGDQLEHLVSEASRIWIVPMTCFHDHLFAFDRKLKPWRALQIELDKETTLKSLRSYCKRSLMSGEPELKAAPETRLRSWRIRVYADAPDWLWFGYSYNEDEIRAVAAQTPVLVKSEVQMNHWLSTHGLIQY